MKMNAPFKIRWSPFRIVYYSSKTLFVLWTKSIVVNDRNLIPKTRAKIVIKITTWNIFFFLSPGLQYVSIAHFQSFEYNFCKNYFEFNAVDIANFGVVAEQQQIFTCCLKTFVVFLISSVLFNSIITFKSAEKQTTYCSTEFNTLLSNNLRIYLHEAQSFVDTAKEIFSGIRKQENKYRVWTATKIFQFLIYPIWYIQSHRANTWLILAQLKNIVSTVSNKRI